MDVDSVLFKSNLEFLSEFHPSDDRSSYDCIVECLDSPIEQQVSDPGEFYFSCSFFDSYDTEFFLHTLSPLSTLSLLLRLILLIINSRALEL